MRNTLETSIIDLSLTGAAVPVDDASRIRDIDVIRGFALFGVVWMNIYETYIHIVPAKISRAFPTFPLDRLIGFASQWLMLSKAQFLFGVLFGFGYAIFVDRALRGGAAGRTLYLRRLAALFGIGLLHLYFLFFGDILHTYAIVGLVLLLTRKWPNALLFWLGMVLTVFGSSLGSLVEAHVLHVDIDRFDMTMMPMLKASLWRSLSEGDYLQQIHASGLFVRTFQLSPHVISLLSSLIGQFMIGAWLFRKGWLQDVAGHRRVFVRATALALPLGLVLAAVAPTLQLLARGLAEGPWIETVDALSRPVLAAGYAAGLVLLGFDPRMHRRLGGLAAFGRMALTNYVTQSLFFMVLIDGYGIGAIRWAGTGADLLFALGITGVQVAWSVWWLRRYRFGPLEWAWRCLTYGARQPLCRTVA